MTLAALLFLASPGSGGLEPCQGVERLVFEDRAGARTEVQTRELALEDPREQGGWVVLPVLGDLPPPVPGAGERLRVELAGGDELRGRVGGGEGEELALELVGGVRLAVRIDRIRSIVPADGAPGTLERPTEGDRLYRVAGEGVDRVDGTLEGFTADGIRFSSRLGEKEFPWSEVAALFVEVLDTGERASEPARLAGVLDLVDGSRLRGSLVRLEPEGARVELGRDEVVIPWGVIGELLVDDGSLAYLSDLAPQAEEGRGTPFGDDLGMVWEHTLDRSVTGAPLRVGGRTYRRGIGTHAPTKLTYDLGGRFHALRGSVGIDDSTATNPEAARGSVVFRVQVDGKTVFESRVVRGGDPALVLPSVDLSGARELVLEADPVEDFRGDRADWLRPILVR